MVDVGAKDITVRRARARARVRMKPETARLVQSGTAPKGDVLAAARIAGIMAAKRTPELIPLCHGIALTRVTVELTPVADGVDIECTTEARDRTGVEMEAMVGASLAALTLYDMLKAVDRAITYDVALLEKSGGKTGDYSRKI
ncbi:cyclic pyranopterin monophosphate synthase MoaC [Pendulispora albinea]|uniref:Cyclic pyranopterin monophosphate synthase MoaC n=2 Tax=Pendulispora albinea TaxID=2741071 RepID=A0ABZ2MCW8_9BACT